MKKRIRDMAGALIKIAAERQLREAPQLAVGTGLYDEFCAGFPYEETDDQRGHHRARCSATSPPAGQWIG